MTFEKKTIKSPIELIEKKSNAKNDKTLNEKRVKELAQKKTAEVASTSDHNDNAVFSHGPSNRGK